MKVTAAEVKELESRGAVLGPTFAESLARNGPDPWTGKLWVNLPGLKVVSEANQREHHMAKHRRKDKQQAWTIFALAGSPKPGKELKLTVTFTREYKGRQKEMDDDNFAGSFKHVRDAVASWLGRSDDSAAGIEWRYVQKRSTRTGVGITIEETKCVS